MGILENRFAKPNILTIPIDFIFNWARRSSLWMLFYGILCCGIEAMATGVARFDFDRYGIIVRNTPRQADMMIIAGPVVKKMVPVLKTLYDQMADPKYVIAMGACAISGGHAKDTYNVVQGAHKVVPVDVFVPGCHPRPEALLYGILKLQEKIRKESVTKGGKDVGKKLEEVIRTAPPDKVREVLGGKLLYGRGREGKTFRGSKNLKRQTFL